MRRRSPASDLSGLEGGGNAVLHTRSEPPITRYKYIHLVRTMSLGGRPKEVVFCLTGPYLTRRATIGRTWGNVDDEV